MIVLAVVEAATLLAGHDQGRVLAAALAAGGLLALLARSVHPLMASIVALGLLAGSVAAAAHTPTVQFIAVLAAFAIVAASNTTRDGAICLVVGLAFLAAATVGFDPGNALGDFVLTAALCCVMWTAGWQVSRHNRTRRRDGIPCPAPQSRARPQRLSDERARIARELHDVVSHGLSVVVLQAMAARSAIEDADAREAARHLDAVESTARDALGEMRRMLGLLQVDDVDDSAAMPSPGLARIPMLVERARSAGLVIDDVGADLSADAPAGVALAAYRIVQEAFTNAVKHAPGASVRFVLTCSDGWVRIDVTSSRGTRNAVVFDTTDGRGLVGMRERAELYGGSLEAGPTADGGFRVHAELQCQDARRRGGVDMIRVLIADDQALVRDGFRSLIDREADLEVVGEAVDGAEAIARTQQYQPDVVLMDVRMPRIDGLTATRRVLVAPVRTARPRAHHIRPQRVGVRRAECRSEWLPAQGRSCLASSPMRSGPSRRGKRCSRRRSRAG